MAKLRGPLHSLEAHGSIANTLTIIKQLGRSIAKKKSAPTGAPSQTQLDRRSTYQVACAAWQALSPSEKLAWKPAGDARQITPFNAYISAALLATPTQGATIWDTGATNWDSGATTWD